MILGTFTPNTPDWHEARRWRVGGSEIGPICGWSHYGAVTRDSIMADKLSGETSEPSRAMRRGNLCEPAVIAHLLDELDTTLDPDLSNATHVGGPDNRRLYNPDGITTSGLLLEAKTTSDRSEANGWGRAGSDKVPLAYAAQCHWGMGLLGLTECRLGVLAGAHNGRPNLHFATYRITFNQRVYDYMARRADAFLAELDTRRDQ